MLKLKHGQPVTNKSGSKYYVIDVLENSVLLNNTPEFNGTNNWYTNVVFLKLFNYKEPFVPYDGEAVYHIVPMTLEIIQVSYRQSLEYFMGKVFKTEVEALEFVNKIKSIA